MLNIYRYVGNISTLTSENGKYSIKLYDSENEQKSPIRLDVGPGLWRYVENVSWSDSEEKYMQTEYYYDSALYLRFIILRTKDGKPVKIIAQANVWDEEVVIFGPKEHINTCNPEAMPMELNRQWHDFFIEHDIGRVVKNKNQQFTNEELEVLSQGMLALICNNNQALQLIHDETCIEVLKSQNNKYRELNDKVCLMM